MIGQIGPGLLETVLKYKTYGSFEHFYEVPENQKERFIKIKRPREAVTPFNNRGINPWDPGPNARPIYQILNLFK